MELKDAVVVITGASSGIGAETARELTRLGAVVVLAARREDDLNALAGEIRAAGGKARVIPADVSKAHDIQRLFDATFAEFGRIDVLVNNAGVGGGKSLMELSDADMERTITVNLTAPARCARAVLPHMKSRKSGVIVNVGSVAGEIGTLGIYSATKFGLRGFTDALRREVLRDGIGVVLIAPGFIQTAMTAGLKVPMPGPRVVARAIARAIRRPRRKIIVPWYYVFLAVLGKLVPSLTDRIIGGKWGYKTYLERKNVMSDE